jgi:hypothetical protein
MQWSLALIDLTTSATPAAMKPDPTFLAALVEGSSQLLNAYATATGQNPAVTFRVGGGPDDRQPGEVACNFRDNIPEAPGALAFHTVTNGVPDIELGVDLFSALTGDSEGMDIGFTHELLEMLRDAGANGWKDNGSGALDAEEACDWVQNSFWTAANGLHLTNFVLESFFIPGAQGPWDQLGVMSSRDDVSHGYGIQAPSPQDTSQVGGIRRAAANLLLPHRQMVGTLTTNQLKRKGHPYSRTSRRGLILTP